MYPSPSESLIPLSSPGSYPMDVNLGYIFLIFFIMLLLLFAIIKYDAIIRAIKWIIKKISSLFSSKKSSSDSTLLSSDGSSESSSSSG
jgi:hypothetical protein